MSKAYEVRISHNLRAAWEIFLKGPEVFIVTFLACIIAVLALNSIPVLGSILSLGISVLVGPAILLMADQTVREGKPTFSVVGKLGELWPQLIVLTLATTVLFFLGFCLLILPFFYLYTAYFFSVPYVVLTKKNFWEGLESSRHLVNKDFWGVGALTLVVGLLYLAGFLLLGIGILFTAPIANILIYTTFKDILQQTGKGNVIIPEVVI